MMTRCSWCGKRVFENGVKEKDLARAEHHFHIPCYAMMRIWFCSSGGGMPNDASKN
jgi:hypothetical protein